jgi:hypothetical protein
MKEKKSKEAFVLVIALVITLAVGLIAVGMVGLTIQEYRLSSRSSAYSQARGAAESGVALACENFVEQVAAGGSVSSLPTTSGDLTDASGTVLSSYNVSAVPLGSDIFVITSTGTCSRASGTIQRTIRVKIQAVKASSPFFKYGVLSAGPIYVGGSSYFDAYDPTDPALSTGGLYDPAKRSTNATLATLSSGSITTNKGKVTVGSAFKADGAAIVYGNVAVGAGGTIELIPSGFITGTKSYDAFQVLAPVVVPISTQPTTTNLLAGSWPKTYVTNWVSDSQDMSVTNLLVTQGGSLTFKGSGTLRIYVKGLTTVDGSAKVIVEPFPAGSSLKVEIYANGTVAIGGSGMVNNTSRSANFSLFGTTNCTSISITGAGSYMGTIYAPQAAIGLTGSGAATGAFVGKSVTFGGYTPYHIDLSLFNGNGGSGGSGGSSGSSKLYKRVEWVEL